MQCDSMRRKYSKYTRVFTMELVYIAAAACTEKPMTTGAPTPQETLMIVDLTLTVRPGMPVYPGDTSVSFSPVHTHERNGCRVTGVTLGTHTGTHIDAPFHMRENGETVETAGILEACVGTAIVVSPFHGNADRLITPHNLGDVPDNLPENGRLLVATGWDERFGSGEYYSGYPAISIELAESLARKGIVLLGLDTPSPDAGDDDRAHRILCDAGIVIVECLANLTRLSAGTVFFSAAPLRLEGLDGSPVRAWGRSPLAV